MRARDKIRELEQLLRDLNNENDDGDLISTNFDYLISAYSDFTSSEDDNVVDSLEAMKEQSYDYTIGAAAGYVEDEIICAEQEKEEEDRIDIGE